MGVLFDRAAGIEQGSKVNYSAASVELSSEHAVKRPVSSEGVTVIRACVSCRLMHMYFLSSSCRLVSQAPQEVGLIAIAARQTQGKGQQVSISFHTAALTLV